MSILKIYQKKKKKKRKYAKNRYKNMSHEKKQKNMSDEKKLKTNDCLKNYHETIKFNSLYLLSDYEKFWLSLLFVPIFQRL